jgi:hypothetical protein
MVKRKGKITPNGVVLETHENATVVFLTEQGYDIELIPPSLHAGMRSPDIVMNNLCWEMKRPLRLRSGNQKTSSLTCAVPSSTKNQLCES